MLNQQASNSNRNGSYRQIVNANKTSLVPGDSIVISYYVSGYGYIDFTSAKTFFSSSAEILDTKKSYLLADFKPLSNNRYVYGGVEVPMDNKMLTILSASMVSAENGRLLVTYFDDFIFEDRPYVMPNKDNRDLLNVDLSQKALIHSESTLGVKGEEKFLAPMTYKIKLKEDTEPGEYYFTYVMTYFNGNSWENDRVELKIKVQHWYERHNNFIQYMALIIAVLTIITLIKPSIKVINQSAVIIIQKVKYLWPKRTKK
ncbi:hypothetical protein GO009_01885 [Muricauda sp. TY007]|uniref:hypothetical protein n=1 Tax=Allomuricauda sp. TY007 TaxID=2683200 RepID=UPI0013C11296|nr:hypothetical protein [Muricauda sp. TY007]NDV14761.1 hypothetical protein [Muricauda sp. TY007]